ncbi:hypothetical protein, partial [Sedimentitalea sp.]|uniref:hypothetical protein n=1 Tax=Sedimentitalea sp. TaxID=2048915 RepID=UPI003297A0C1
RVLACGQRALAHVSYMESTRAKAPLNRDQTDQFYTGKLTHFAPGLTVVVPKKFFQPAGRALANYDTLTLRHQFNTSRMPSANVTLEFQ